jgi:ketosteroid isomerase-like protein
LKKSLLGIFVLAFVSLRGGMAADKASIKSPDVKRLDAAYVSYEKAVTHNDVKAFMNLLAPGFVAINAEGKKSTAQEQASALAEMFDAMTNMKLTHHFNKVTIKGKEAILNVTTQLYAYVSDPTRVAHPLQIRDTSKDTWVRTTGGWKLLRTQSLKQRATMDGNEIKKPAQ